MKSQVRGLDRLSEASCLELRVGLSGEFCGSMGCMRAPTWSITWFA